MIFYVFFIIVQNHINAELDKTEMLMNFKKKKTLSTEKEFYQKI